MTADVLLILAGLVILVRGGDLFVSAAVRIAGFLRVPHIVIGSTLVSLATTTPELAVSVTAGVQDAPGLAVGNAIGSCLCNIGLILGLGAILRPIVVHPRTIFVPLGAMIAACAALFLMTLDLSLNRRQGMLLVGVGIAYFASDLWRHIRHARRRETADAVSLEASLAPPAVRWSWFATRLGTAVQFAASALLVVFGSDLLVRGAVGLAGALGISPLVIGLSVVAIGTSLPELVTAVTSARQAVSDLSVGNVIGANLANLTLVVGTAACLQHVRLERSMQVFNFPVALAFMAALAAFCLWRRRIGRAAGAFLIASYAAYLAVLVVLGGPLNH